MAKFVRNDSGTIHSVADDFTLPAGWEEVDEAAARAENPGLVGETPETPIYDEVKAESAATEGEAA